MDKTPSGTPVSVYDKIVHARWLMVTQNGEPPSHMKLGRNQIRELLLWKNNGPYWEKSLSDVFGMEIEEVNSDDFLLVYKVN